MVATITAAIMAGLVALTGYLYNGLANRKDQARRNYADAISAVMDYKGLPFRIRRRMGDDPVTRTELLALASSLHERLDFHQAFVFLERPRVGVAYSNLVATVRREAGDYCDAAWRSPVIESRATMESNLSLATCTPSPTLRRRQTTV